MKAEEFNLHFHSLEGITLREKHKSLFLLLHKAKQESLAVDFATLQPKTLLEEKFKIEALIYFRKVQELIEILKCENPHFVAIILKKSKWFIKELFNNFAEGQLINLFPSLSFNTKVKIINKISKYLINSQQTDVFFENVDVKYGSYLAFKLLPNCQPNFILDFLKKNRFKPTPKQVLCIVRNNPEITEDILKILADKEINVTYEYKYVLNYLAQNDFLLFLKLHKQYNWSLKLGRRLTHKCIKLNKQSVISSPTKYYGYLHKKQIAKSVGHDFEQLFCNLFPTKLEDFNYFCLYSILNGLPVKMKSPYLLTRSFKKMYGSSFWDHPKLVEITFIDMLTPEERENRLKIEYKPDNMSLDMWMCYSKIDSSIPYLKNRISLTSNSKTRAMLVELLVKTCKLNSDLNALGDVCNYIINIHHNDSHIVRNAFLNAISQEYDLTCFNINHWECINTLLEISALDDQPINRRNFLERYISYRFSNNLLIDNQLALWISLKYDSLNIVEEKPECEKMCLLKFSKIIKESFQNKDLDYWNILYLQALINWNKRHPKTEIPLDIKAGILTLKNAFKNKNNSYTSESILMYFLKRNLNTLDKAELINIFFKRNNCAIHNLPQMLWWLQYDPLVIVENIESAIKLILVEWKSQIYFPTFWKICQNYSHLNIPQQMVTLFSKTFEEIRNCNDHFVDDQLSIIFQGLSYLMSTDSFLQFVTEYNPTELQVNLKTKESKKLYTLQQIIGPLLKNVVPPSCVMRIILIYCKGDYLKLVRSSLYSVVGNVNEEKVELFLNELLDRAISVRKHALHLAFRVLDKAQVYSMLKHFMQTEQNASIRKFIFKGCFDFFVKNSNDYSWELVKLNLNAVDIEDTEAVDVLMQIDKIPSQYVVKYVTFTWEVLDKIPDKRSHQARLLNSLSHAIIPLLPKEFCENIIKEHFYTWGPDNHLRSDQSTIIKFVCEYIIYCNSKVEQEERLTTKFEILKNFITNSWNTHEGRNCAIDFLKKFCKQFLTDESSDNEILIKFVKLWNDFVKPYEAFSAFLHTQFTLIYMKKLPYDQLAFQISQLCDSLSEQYGNVIIGMFFNKLTFFFDYFFKNETTEENFYIFFENIFKRNSVTCCLLVILLINKYKPQKSDNKTKYYEIVKALENKQNSLIQLYLYNHLGDAIKLHCSNI